MKKIIHSVRNSNNKNLSYKDNKNLSYKEQLEEDLFKAIRYNDTEAIGDIIELGADVNVTRTVDGFTPLMCAVSNNNSASVCKLLINGANPNLASPKIGATPVSIALKSGDFSPKIVNILLAFGAKTTCEEVKYYNHSYALRHNISEDIIDYTNYPNVRQSFLGDYSSSDSSDEDDISSFSDSDEEVDEEVDEDRGVSNNQDVSKNMNIESKNNETLSKHSEPKDECDSWEDVAELIMAEMKITQPSEVTNITGAKESLLYNE